MTLATAILLAAAAAEPSGIVTRAPELEHFVDATYPPEELAAHRGAEVVMDVDIDEAGAVTAVQVSSVSLDPLPASPDPQAEARFAHAAVEAAAQFRFSPAEIDGRPAAVRITYRYRFTIREERTAPAEAPITIGGRLLERGTRRPLSGASVAVEGGPSAEADAQGRFALRGVAPGRWRIRVVSPDHERFETEEEVRAGEMTEVTYYVHRRAASPYETVVQGERDRKEVAKRSLSLEEIKRVPGTSGDAVAVVQMLPGVARAPYGLGLLSVRGTLPADTRGYLDGISIPNVFHFGGLPISVVNADALSGIDFYPGNSSARFGRALGGTVELRSRPGAADGIHGFGDVSLIDAKALVEAPTTENGSFLATARRSYVDLVLAAAGVDSVSPRYYDYLVRHDWKLKDGRAAVYAYGSSDVLMFHPKSSSTANPEQQEESTTATSFHRLQGLYEKALSDQVTARAVAALGYDEMDFNFGSTSSGAARFWGLQLRAEIGWVASKAFELTAGVDSSALHASYSVLAHPTPAPGQIVDAILARELVHDSGTGNYALPGAYLYAIWAPLPRLRLVPGLRADLQDGFSIPTTGRIDPRLSAFYDLAPWLTLKAAAGLYSEPPPYSQGQLTPRFGNPDLGFQQSRQYMVGASGRLGPATSFDVQVYYKDLSQLVIPSNLIVERGGVLQAENYDNGGFGFSRGIEVLLRQELSRGLFGWLSYTLSESRQKVAEGFPVTNFPFDQRHNFYAVISQRLPHDWTVGGSVRYTTGSWETPVTRGVYDSDCDCYRAIAGPLYSQRLPDFFELDLRVDKRWVYQRWSLGVYLDLRNVTNRRNIELSRYSYDFSQRVDVPGFPFFPNIGVRGEF
jgi:TonB family protein